MIYSPSACPIGLPLSLLPVGQAWNISSAGGPQGSKSLSHLSCSSQCEGAAALQWASPKWLSKSMRHIEEPCCCYFVPLVTLIGVTGTLHAVGMKYTHIHTTYMMLQSLLTLSYQSPCGGNVFHCLHPWPCPFGQDPDLMTVDESGNYD